MPDTERFDMVLPKWLKEAIKACAKKRGVGMSEWVKDALKDAVKKDNADGITNERPTE